MFLVVFCFIVFVSFLLLLDVKKPFRYPPGPKWIPILGNFTQFHKRLKVLGYHHLVWKELSEKYGPIVGLRMGRNLVVTVFGCRAVKEVLTRDEFDGRPDGFFFRLRTFGKRLGIVFSEGPFWQKQRRFSLQHLKSFGFGRREMELQIAEETRELVESLKTKCGEPIFMHNAFDISVLNVLWAMMAGQRFSLDDEKLKTLLQIIHDAFRLIDMSGGVLNQMPFLRFIAPNACGYNQICDILRRMWIFLEEIIADHRKTMCNTQARDLIDAFIQKMEFQKDTDSTFTDEQMLSVCLDLLMAGSETTSNTLGFAVLYMMNFPHVQIKVQREMDEIVGRNRTPTLQDRSKLPFTDAVLAEIQRRTNVPPLGIAHRATKDAELLGYKIPEGTIVLTSLYSVHMDADYWEDPEEFRPERFIDEFNKIDTPDWHFAPFGYGKRRCLGESLAKASLFLFFTSLLHHFSIEVSPDSDSVPSLEGFDGVTVSPKPFKALLTPRLD